VNQYALLPLNDGMVWYGKCEFIYVTKSNALSMLVAREKPDFQALMMPTK